MVEAVPVTGVQTSAPEFRRMLGLIYANEGVIEGLAVTVGANQVSVSPGGAAIQDSQSVPAFWLAPVDASFVVAVDAQASGSRADALYIAVNDTGADLTVNGVVHANGQAYCAVNIGSTSIPANATSLGTLTVAPSGITYAVAGRTKALLRSGATDSVRTDVSSVLFEGTTASTPSEAGHVATKGYVDGKVSPYQTFSPTRRWDWGNSSYDWFVETPTWSGTTALATTRDNEIPGSERTYAGYVIGHLYQVVTEFSVEASGSAAGMRFSTWVDGALLREHHHARIVSGQVLPVTLTTTFRATKTTHSIRTRMATNTSAAHIIGNGWVAPHTEVIDLGVRSS